MKSIIVILIIGFLIFELIEHVIFPLFFIIKNRKKRSICGASGMPGKVGEIKYWHGSEGKIFVDGELWRATSPTSFTKGDKAVIQRLNGLTLRVGPYKKIARELID